MACPLQGGTANLAAAAALDSRDSARALLLYREKCGFYPQTTRAEPAFRPRPNGLSRRNYPSDSTNTSSRFLRKFGITASARSPAAAAIRAAESGRVMNTL